MNKIPTRAVAWILLLLLALSCVVPAFAADTAAHTVCVAGRRVELTLKEYSLLQQFVSHPGRVFTRENLLEQIWGIDFVGESRTVDVHIGTLRTKLGVCGNYIKTVRGVGYRLEAEE